MKPVSIQQLPLKKLAIPKETVIGWFSSLIEAYNMAIYSFLAPILAIQLFPDELTWKALFFSYGLVFLGSCLCYPIGAIYYGFLGDKKGRQRTCTYSTLGLSLATGLMGIVPIDSLGGLAWLAFFGLICLQYFFSGGEYHGSVVFSLEHLEDKSKGGLTSGTSCFFAVIGLLAANGFATVSMIQQNAIWVKSCFVVGGIGGFIGYLLKNHCRETPEFCALAQEGIKTTHFVQSEWKTIGGAILALAFFIIAYAFIFIFLPLVHERQVASDNFATFKAFIAYGILLVASGYLADHWGMQRTMAIGSGLFALAIVPVCYFCKDLLIIQLILTFLACLVIGPIHSWLVRQFPVDRRCRGIFISSAVAFSLFGGSTVPICLLLFEQFHSLAICSLYPLIVSISVCVYLSGSKILFWRQQVCDRLC